MKSTPEALAISHLWYHLDTSGGAESQGSPWPSPGDPTAGPCSGLSGRPPCLHLRGEGTGSTWKGFSPVWTSWCRFSLELSTKALPHSAQTWTLGPWVCRCFLMAELSLNIFVQPFEQREKLSGPHCELTHDTFAWQPPLTQDKPLPSPLKCRFTSQQK